MLTIKEQKLLLEMYLKGPYTPKVFTREQLKEMGNYISDSGLSRALSNIYMHFFIEKVGPEKSHFKYEEDLTIRGKKIRKKRMEAIRRMKKKYERTAIKERVKFMLSEEGIDFAHILMKAEKWKIESKKL